METKGIPVSRWFDGVLENKEDLQQPNNVRGMVFCGHAPNSQTRLPDLKKGMDKLDLLVVIDPVPTLSAVLSDRKEGTYLLPAGSTMEYAGRSEEHTSELQSLMRISYAVFCLKKKQN